MGQVDARLFMAGQVPLVPATLDLVEPRTWARQVALSSQHVRRLIAAAPSGRDYQLETGVVWTGAGIATEAAVEAWLAFSEDPKVRGAIDCSDGAGSDARRGGRRAS